MHYHWEIKKIMINMDINLDTTGIGFVIGWNQLDIYFLPVVLSLWYKTAEYEKLSQFFSIGSGTDGTVKQ